VLKSVSRAGGHRRYGGTIGLAPSSQPTACRSGRGTVSGDPVDENVEHETGIAIRSWRRSRRPVRSGFAMSVVPSSRVNMAFWFERRRRVHASLESARFIGVIGCSRHAAKFSLIRRAGDSAGRRNKPDPAQPRQAFKGHRFSTKLVADLSGSPHWHYRHYRFEH
jgi:hypothetical protein